MLGTLNPSVPTIGDTDGMKAASAAGRPDGGRKATTGDFTRSASHRSLKRSSGLDFAYMAVMLGLFPR